MANKVVLLAPTPPPAGGIAMWTVRMMNAKLEHGWQVEVVDEKIMGKREFFGDKTKRNYFTEVKRCLNIWNDLKIKLKDKQIKVVHSCIAANTLPVIREYVCACITKHRRRKFIIHFRCTVPNVVKGKINRFLVKKLCDKSDCVMLLNKQSEDYIRKLTNTQVRLIPNFVDTQEVVEKYRINRHIKKAVYVGGVIEKKGCLEIIEVAKQFPEIEFRLIGNAEQKVRNAANGIENVVLTGARNHAEVQKELRDADLFIFLSYFSGECFSNALAEAMAAGLPCLVSDWAANADMIEGKGGEVVPARDVKAAVKALQKMMPAEVRKSQSEFNIDKIKKTYSDEIVLKQYVDCYENLL